MDKQYTRFLVEEICENQIGFVPTYGNTLMGRHDIGRLERIMITPLLITRRNRVRSFVLLIQNRPKISWITMTGVEWS